MIYLDLFLGFLRVGLFAFGGAYGAIPLIRDVVLSYGWLSDDMLTYMIAVSESTPGPIMVNLATYVGSSQAGLLGAILATLAVVLPSFIIILLVMILLKTLLKNKYVQAILRGLKPCVIGIVLATGIWMILNNCFSLKRGFTFDWKTLLLTFVLGGIMFGSKPLLKKKVTVIRGFDRFFYKEDIMIYGYARCSTNESKQDINRQIKELKAAGADEVIFEYEHGDARTKKELNLLLELAQAGDTIITLEVSRLSRSTQQLCELIDIIREKRLRLVIMGSITIDCREGKADPMSEAFLQMAGVFSQLELAMIRARVKSGMENAKAKGKKIGRRPTTKEDIPSNFLKHYAIFMEGKMNVSELARVCGLSRPTVYKYLKMMG